MNPTITYEGMTLDPAQFVQTVVSTGGNQVGDIANTLLTIGLGLADISQVIQAAQSGGLMPAQQAAALQQELAYVEYKRQQESSQKTILIVGALLAVAYFATKK